MLTKQHGRNTTIILVKKILETRKEKMTQEEMMILAKIISRFKRSIKHKTRYWKSGGQHSADEHTLQTEAQCTINDKSGQEERKNDRESPEKVDATEETRLKEIEKISNYPLVSCSAKFLQAYSSDDMENRKNEGKSVFGTYPMPTLQVKPAVHCLKSYFELHYQKNCDGCFCTFEGGIVKGCGSLCNEEILTNIGIHLANLSDRNEGGATLSLLRCMIYQGHVDSGINAQWIVMRWWTLAIFHVSQTTPGYGIIENNVKPGSVTQYILQEARVAKSRQWIDGHGDKTGQSSGGPYSMSIQTILHGAQTATCGQPMDGNGDQTGQSSGKGPPNSATNSKDNFAGNSNPGTGLSNTGGPSTPASGGRDGEDPRRPTKPIPGHYMEESGRTSANTEKSTSKMDGDRFNDGQNVPPTNTNLGTSGSSALAGEPCVNSEGHGPGNDMGEAMSGSGTSGIGANIGDNPNLASEQPGMHETNNANQPIGNEHIGVTVLVQQANARSLLPQLNVRHLNNRQTEQYQCQANGEQQEWEGALFDFVEAEPVEPNEMDPLPMRQLRQDVRATNLRGPELKAGSDVDNLRDEFFRPYQDAARCDDVRSSVSSIDSENSTYGADSMYRPGSPEQPRPAHFQYNELILDRNWQWDPGDAANNIQEPLNLNWGDEIPFEVNEHDSRSYEAPVDRQIQDRAIVDAILPQEVDDDNQEAEIVDHLIRPDRAFVDARLPLEDVEVDPGIVDHLIRPDRAFVDARLPLEDVEVDPGIVDHLIRPDRAFVDARLPLEDVEVDPGIVDHLIRPDRAFVDARLPLEDVEVDPGIVDHLIRPDRAFVDARLPLEDVEVDPGIVDHLIRPDRAFVDARLPLEDVEVDPGIVDHLIRPDRAFVDDN